MPSTSSISKSPLTSSSTLCTDEELARNRTLRSALTELMPSTNELASGITTALQLNKQFSTDHDVLWPRPPVDSYYYPHHVSVTSRLRSCLKSILNRSTKSKSQLVRDAESLSHAGTALQNSLSSVITKRSAAQKYHEGDEVKTYMLDWRKDHARFYGEQRFASRLPLHTAIDASLSRVTSSLQGILGCLRKVSSRFDPDQISERDFADSAGEDVSDIEVIQQLLDACDEVVPLLEEESEIITKLLCQKNEVDGQAIVAREPHIPLSRPDNFVFQ